MAEHTGISWSDGTFNTHWICTETGPPDSECMNCYARELAARFGYGWGRGVPRRAFGDKHWGDPVRWDKKAAKAGTVMKVFSNSMSDILDPARPPGTWERLCDLIDATPHITWQLLTKRAGAIHKEIPQRWRDAPPRNVWMGVTCGYEPSDWRVEALRKLRGQFPVLWISAEPLLGPLTCQLSGIDWVVLGGESGGAKARRMEIPWLRDGIARSRDAGAAVFVKQMGSHVARDWRLVTPEGKPDDHGKTPLQWPEEFRDQEFPPYSAAYAARLYAAEQEVLCPSTARS